MQQAPTARDINQAAFQASVDASAKDALRLKRHGYEQRAVANGDSVTATGRMLTMVKKRFSSAFAFLTGSNSLLTQLALADSFSNNAGIGNVWNALKNWGANFSQSVDTNVIQSPTEIAQEFAMEAACANVVAELEEQEARFEKAFTAAANRVIEQAPENFIGPLPELEAVHDSVQQEYELQQVFHANGTCTYRHCADKVQNLRVAFNDPNALISPKSHDISNPSTRVMVYNSVASASSEAPVLEPSRRSILGIEAPHLQPTSCPA